MGVTTNSLSSTRSDKLAQSITFLTVVHSFTHVRSSIQDKECPLLDPGIHTASKARLQHDGGHLVRFKLSRRTDNPSAFPCVRCSRTHALSLDCLGQQGYLSDLRADTGTLFFPDEIQTQHSQTRLHKGRECVVCQRDADGALGDSWCG